MRLVYLLFFCFLIASCKDPCKPPDTIIMYSLSPDVKDYGVFKLGTFWVYINDSTQQKDSARVTVALLDTFPIEESCIGGVTEYFTSGYVERFDATIDYSLAGETLT